jgi:hypothetical protein
MARIEVRDGELVVEQGAIESMFSMRGRIRVPLDAVVRIYADPTVAEEPKGIKAPGTHLPRLFVAGTFHAAGVKTFWNIRRGERCVVVQVRGQKFDRFVIEVDDPAAVVAAVDAGRRDP